MSPDSPGRLPLAVLVLTCNEARNLPACLESIRAWVPSIVVVDSGSTDGTQAIAKACGALVLDHAFETHARQWQWALAAAPLEANWVLCLDADQRVTPGLRASIEHALATDAGTVFGYFVARRQIFRGRWIRHGGYYPKYLLKLIRRSAAFVDPTELVDHHFQVSGVTAKLAGDLIEDNRNEVDIAAWTAKHNRYAVLQARQEFALIAARTTVPLRAIWTSPDHRTRWLKQWWARLPLFVRPCAYVFYRYVLRLGFLDGKQGFIFHVLQGFWYRLLVDVNIDDLTSAAVAASGALNGGAHAVAGPTPETVHADASCPVPPGVTESANLR